MPNTVEIRPPFLVYLGDAPRFTDAKTGAGLVQWRRKDCVGQIRLTSETTSIDLPDLSIAEAKAAGVKSLVIGVAPLGGRLPANWLPALEEVARAGFDLVNGLHDQLTNYPNLVEAVRAGGGRLIDLRIPPRNIPVGTGAPRSGLRLLTVGVDCAVGKKYAALAIAQEMENRGMDAAFCATGQTGIMISGGGVPLDAVPCDFISGAIEELSPAAPDGHWDIIEGQGSLYHPSYAGVTLGLIHGAQPDAIVLCAEAGRDRLSDLPDFKTPGLNELSELTLHHARLTNPRAAIVGVCLNTSSLSDGAALAACDKAAAELNAPAVDPVRHGVSDIVDQCREISV